MENYIVTKRDGLIYVSTPEDPSYDAIFGRGEDMIMSGLIRKYCGWQDQAYRFEQVFFREFGSIYLFIDCRKHLTMRYPGMEEAINTAFWLADRNHDRD